jgi:phospholipid transport system transporter-binding protein
MSALALPQTLTQAQATACLAGLRAQAGAGAVQVDASALRQFDSSALSVLLALRRDCLARSQGFAVKGMPARLGQLAALYGVDGLLSSR